MSTAHAIDRAPDERVNWITSIPFFLIHVLCLLAIVTGVTGEGARPLRGPLLRAHVVHHRRLPPLLLAPQLQDEPGLPVRPRLRRRHRGPEGRPLVGGHHRDHHRYSDTERDVHSPLKGFWWSHVGWILCDKNNGLGPGRHQGLRQVPGAALPHQARLDRRRGPLGVASLPHRRLARPGRRLLLVDRAALARHVHRELARPRDGPPPLRHHRHQPELGPHRALDRRRGLAQQPPLLPGRRPATASSGGSTTRPTTGSRC